MDACCFGISTFAPLRSAASLTWGVMTNDNDLEAREVTLTVLNSIVIKTTRNETAV